VVDGRPTSGIVLGADGFCRCSIIRSVANLKKLIVSTCQLLSVTRMNADSELVLYLPRSSGLADQGPGVFLARTDLGVDAGGVPQK
jgi:hypothetical protein